MRWVPAWALEKVLILLESEQYNNETGTLYNLLKKNTFLTALASGNSVSELGALHVAGTSGEEDHTVLIFAVRPGFIFKTRGREEALQTRWWKNLVQILRSAQ